MAMGLGHKYVVQLIKWHYGTLEECIKWMEKNKQDNNLYWFELHPHVEIKKGERIKVNQYRVDLVTDGGSFKK